jgi:hypothetical protein
MEINFLKKLKNNQTINWSTIEGISENEISKTEKKLQIKFPTAYKEFLFLAGEYTGGLRLLEGNSNLSILSHNDTRKQLANVVDKLETPIKKSFWVFSEKDAFEQFFFFYLDENSDDPIVWFNTYGEDDSKNIIIKLKDKFSLFINDVVDKSILFQQRGY